MDVWKLIEVPGPLRVLIAAPLIYGAVIVFTRIVGLRSFSKMSSFDFAMTVAVGSTVAGTLVADKPDLIAGALTLFALFAMQWIVAALRRSFPGFGNAIDNSPVLLMHGREFIEENMHRARVTRSDVYAKLREANVLDLDQVRAVVLETTGDISVLHSADSEQRLESQLLDGVRRGAFEGEFGGS